MSEQAAESTAASPASASSQPFSRLASLPRPLLQEILVEAVPGGAALGCRALRDAWLTALRDPRLAARAAASLARGGRWSFARHFYGTCEDGSLTGAGAVLGGGPLLRAVLRGVPPGDRCDVVFMLLSEVVRISTREPLGTLFPDFSTGLKLVLLGAAAYNHTALVVQLREGWRLLLREDDVAQALAQACRWGCVGAASELLAEVATYAGTQRERSLGDALAAASHGTSAGHTELVRWLLGAGADPRVGGGCAALGHAAAAGAHGTVALLLQAGADPCKDNCTVLLVAARRLRLRVLAQLLAAAHFTEGSCDFLVEDVMGPLARVAGGASALKHSAAASLTTSACFTLLTDLGVSQYAALVAARREQRMPQLLSRQLLLLRALLVGLLGVVASALLLLLLAWWWGAAGAAVAAAGVACRYVVRWWATAYLGLVAVGYRGLGKPLWSVLTGTVQRRKEHAAATAAAAAMAPVMGADDGAP